MYPSSPSSSCERLVSPYLPEPGSLLLVAVLLLLYLALYWWQAVGTPQVHAISIRTHNSSLEGAMKLNFWPKTMDYSPWFIFGGPKKVCRNVYHLKGNKKRNLMALVSVA